LSFSQADACKEQLDGTIKEFIPAQELQRRAAQGKFSDLFIMVLFFIAERNAWSTVTGPLTQVLDVVNVKDLKESVVHLMMETYPELCNKADMSVAFDNELDWLFVWCALL